MSGLEIQTTHRCGSDAMRFPNPTRDVHPIISVAEGDLFARIVFEGVQVFLDPCPSRIDLSRPVAKACFDIRDNLCPSLPIVMYLRFAFAEVAWSPIENGACLIVDDPVLRPRYGCLDYKGVLELAREHRFSCTLAFIPWNWRRSRTPVVEMFKNNSERLSICFHGADHTAGEFGAHSTAILNAAAKLARGRMSRHEMLTGLPTEPIMVFPQGIFSAEAISVLKHNAFAAAVNTVVSPQGSSTKPTIGETWKPAICSYDGFPIYTRRYPAQGLGNFAFDLMLGKPALIVTHHQDFLHRGREIAAFIDSLNSIKAKLNWRTLGEVVRRAHSQRLRRDGTREINLFAYEAAIENSSANPQAIRLLKPARDCQDLEWVDVGGERCAYEGKDGGLSLESSVDPGQELLVRLHYRDIYGDARLSRSVPSQARVAVRRILSEARDEAFARAPKMVGAMLAARKYFRGRH
jgi:hypothetical protein